MARKRLFEDQPPTASSSEEEEESDRDAVEEEEEHDDVKETSGDEVENGEEEAGTSVQEPIVASYSQSLKPDESSDSDDDSGSRSDSDSDKTPPSPTASAFTVRPIISKPAGDSLKAKKNVLHPISTPTTSKRRAESRPNGNDLKRKKVTNVEGEDGKKGNGFQRIWSEDDEIAILKGIIDYKSKNGTDPLADMGAFHEFMKKNIKVDVSKNQFMDKIRRLKKKYHNKAGKGENGEHPVISNPHELKSFELSKKIWSTTDSKKKSSKKISKLCNLASLTSSTPEVAVARKEEVNGDNKVGPDEFLSDYPWLNASFKSNNNKLWSERLMHLVRQRTPSIGSAKARDLDLSWKELSMTELEFFLKKVDLVKDQTRLIMESLGSARS